MPRRPLRFLVILIVLGVVTNIAIAWVLSLDLVPGDRPMRFARAGYASDGNAVSLTRRDLFGAVAFAAAAVPEGSFTIPEDQEVPLEEAVPGWAMEELLGWIDDDPLPLQWAEARAILATGWPLPCMYSTYDQQPSNGYWWFKARDGIKVAPAPANPNHFAPLSPRERVLPMRFVWFPAVVCSMFWALIWAMLLLGPGASRRFARKRRGKCVACGYDRRGIDASARCPECGAAGTAPGA